MKASRQTTFRLAALVVIITVFLISTELAPGNASDARQRATVRPRHEHARLAPVSDKMISAKITVDDDAPLEAAQLEGGLIRVNIFGKAIYGFSPVISDPLSRAVTIKVFRISETIYAGEATGESLEQVDALLVEKADEKYSTAYWVDNSSFKIEILGVQTDPQGREGLAATNYANLMADCCVICDGKESCACRVSTSCGGCCDGPCCQSSNELSE